MNHFLKWITAIFFIAYPFIVGWSLSNGHFFAVSILLVMVGMSRLVFKSNALLWPLSMFAILCGGLSVMLNDHAWLKFYSVLMSLGALGIFASTLWRPPSMIERFARIMQPDLPESGVQWTRKVTIVWCGFFIFNAVIAWCTIVYAPTQIWMLYNGFISYVLMGILLLGEFILRKRHQRLNNNDEQFL